MTSGARAALVLSLALAGCEGFGGKDAFVAGETDAAASACASPATDSARAVCAGLAAIERHGLPSRVFEVTREGDTYCVITSPRAPRVIDGMGVARVGVDGTVYGAVLTDSASCGAVPTPRRG